MVEAGRLFRVGLVVCLGLVLAAGAAQAAPDWTVVGLRKQLSALSQELRVDGALRSLSVRELTAGLDWQADRTPLGPPVAFREPVEPARLGFMDLRLAIAPITQVYGAKDRFDILQVSERNANEAIVVESGVATLAQLRARFANWHLGKDLDTGADLLRAPLVVNAGATLRLGPADVLRLSRSDGAFIVNFGRLEVFGGEISGTPEPSLRNDEFVPFVTSVGSGSARLSGATLRGLGFGNTAAFSGFSVLAHPAMRPAAQTVIEDSRFESLVTVAFVGTSGVALRGNRFFDMRRNAILVSRSAGAVLDGNLFSGVASTNAVRITNGSVRTVVRGNIVLEGDRTGFLISSGSDDVHVVGNLIWRRDGGGVKLRGVACGVVEGNLLIDDRQKGVEVRESRAALVRNNRIVGNKSAGVWISAQPDGEVTYVTGNLLRENGTGLATASAGVIALSGNDFSEQNPRLVDGDITPQFRAVVADLRGRHPIALSASGASPASRLVPEGCTTR